MTSTRTRTPKTARTETHRAPAKAPRRKVPAVLVSLLDVVDDRTDDLADIALLCRLGHEWREAPKDPKTFLQLAARGLVEDLEVCQGCKSIRKCQRYYPSFIRIGQYKYIWSDGYLLAEQFRGRGRLTRDQVRQALAARRTRAALGLTA